MNTSPQHTPKLAPSGLWWDDASTGQTWVSAARTITEADVVNFAGVSGDFNALHMDAPYAAASRFGQRVVHGALVLSIATGLRGRLGIFDGTLIAFAEIRSWTFAAPVLIGDTVHCVNEIVELHETSKPDRGIMVQRVSVLNQRDEVVQHGEMVSLMRRRVA